MTHAVGGVRPAHFDAHTLGLTALVCGGVLLAAAVNQWVIPGSTLAVLGCQTILSSFFVSLLGMRRK